MTTTPDVPETPGREGPNVHQCGDPTCPCVRTGLPPVPETPGEPTTRLTPGDNGDVIELPPTGDDDNPQGEAMTRDTYTLIDPLSTPDQRRILKGGRDGR